MVKIGKYEVENFQEPFIIAEAGSNHNGQLDLAKKLVDKAVECGAHSIKFQAFDLDLFSDLCYEDHPKRAELMQKSKELEYWFTKRHPELKKEMLQNIFKKEFFVEIKKYCDEKGIIFFCTPLSYDAVDFLVDELGMEFIKVASMDLNNYPFLEYIAKKGKPVVLSTGMGDFSEIAKAVEVILKHNKELVVLHCISIYPPKDEDINLRNMDMLRDAFGLPTGFSDHTFGISIPLAAVARGACMIEKHFTLDKNMPGWDHKISADEVEMKAIVEESKKIVRALGSTKRTVRQDELDKRAFFRRSVVVSKNLSEGHVLSKEDLDVKRPGIGVEPWKIDSFFGRKLKRPLVKDELISFDDIV